MRSGLLIPVIWIGMFTGLKGQGLFESGLNSPDNQILTISGYIRSVTYAAKEPETKDYYLQSAYAQTSLQFLAKPGSWGSAKADLRFRYGTEFGQPVSEIDLREAYIHIYKGMFDLTAGKQIRAWGKGTVFNPTRLGSPADPTVRSPVEDDMNLGTWMILAGMNLGLKTRISGFWNPVYRPSVLLIDPVPMPSYVHFQEPLYPGAQLNEGSYGAKADLHTGILDASLSWFDGYHALPGIAFQSFRFDSLTLQPEELNLAEKAYRVRMLGGDLALPVSNWMIRMEGAWQMMKEKHPQHEYLPFPEITYTTEIEWTGAYISAVAGYYGKYIPDFEPSDASPSLEASQEDFLALLQTGIPLTREGIDRVLRDRIASFNRLYNYQQEKFYHAGFLVLTGNLWQQRIEWKVPLVYHFTTREVVIQPGLSVKPADGLEVSAGYNGFFGPGNSLFDLIGPALNAAYLSIRITF